jgi:hypothetical protein
MKTANFSEVCRNGLQRLEKNAVLPSVQTGLIACFVCFLLATMFILPATILADDNSSAFRVFYIYKFALYLKYPTEQQGDFVITVVGDDAVLVEDLRKNVANKKVGDRAIKVQVADDARSIAASQLVFIPQRSGARLAQIMQMTHGKPVVVVSENAQCQNSCINLTLQGSAIGKKRFEINRDNMESGGVKVSSDLMAIAGLCQ